MFLAHASHMPHSWILAGRLHSSDMWRKYYFKNIVWLDFDTVARGLPGVVRVAVKSAAEEATTALARADCMYQYSGQAQARSTCCKAVMCFGMPTWPAGPEQHEGCTAIYLGSHHALHVARFE